MFWGKTYAKLCAEYCTLLFIGFILPETVQVCSLYQWKRNGTTFAVLILYLITVLLPNDRNMQKAGFLMMRLKIMLVVYITESLDQNGF